MPTDLTASQQRGHAGLVDVPDGCSTRVSWSAPLRDRRILIDPWMRVPVVRINLTTVESRVVEASIDTYLKYSEAVGAVSSAAIDTSPGSKAEARSARGWETLREIRRSEGGLPDATAS